MKWNAALMIQYMHVLYRLWTVRGFTRALCMTAKADLKQLLIYIHKL